VVAPASAPFQAVADTVVRFSPAGLTEFGKSGHRCHQTAAPAPPIPDGAAGWPGIRFAVA
jgi:hypothetical protein